MGEAAQAPRMMGVGIETTSSEMGTGHGCRAMVAERTSVHCDGDGGCSGRDLLCLQ